MKNIKLQLCLLLVMVMGMGRMTACPCSASEETIAVQNSVINQATEMESEFDATLESAHVVVDGIVHNLDIQVTDGEWYLAAQDAKTAFGDTFTEEYVSLDAYAQATNISYTQDEVLNAAYFSTWNSYSMSAAELSTFESLIKDIGLPAEKADQTTLSGIEMAELLDCFVKYAAPDKLSGWKEVCPALRSSAEPLLRIEVLTAAFLAINYVGSPYTDYTYDTGIDPIAKIAMFTDESSLNIQLFGGDHDLFGDFDMGKYGVDNFCTAACYYNLLNICPVDGKYPLAYDEKAGSFYNGKNASYLDGLMVILRSAANAELQTVSVEDSAITQASGILSEALLAKANESPAVNAENHPRWTGLVLNGETEYSLGAIPNQMIYTANWGFNSVRLNLQYEQIFDRAVTEANLARLFALDRIVATAIAYNLHLNICMTTLPGRWVGTTDEFEFNGEFDLFVNPEKQVQANRIFEILAKRYQDVPNAFLSFSPLFEATNHNLSSGLPYEEYTSSDVGTYLAQAVDLIRTYDPDRLIIYEPTSSGVVSAITEESQDIYDAVADIDNLICSYNYCAGTYLYANMTAEDGKNIDDENHSYYLVDYPTYFYALRNCIIDVTDEDLRGALPNEWMEGDGSLFLDGCLPAGTVIELYLKQTYGGTLQITADGVVIYEENLDDSVYESGEIISNNLRYAESDKCIQFILEQDTDLIKIAIQDGAATWTGMLVHLPEEYTAEHWYYATAYDVHLGLEEESGAFLKRTSDVMIWPYDEDTANHITIHEDVSYSTEQIREEASRDTIRTFVKAASEIAPNGMLRYESDDFSGSIFEMTLRYYRDILSSFSDYGMGWYSNDWITFTGGKIQDIVGAEYVRYGEFDAFNVELLQLLQKYQNSERP